MTPKMLSGGEMLMSLLLNQDSWGIDPELSTSSIFNLGYLWSTDMLAMIQNIDKRLELFVQDLTMHYSWNKCSLEIEKKGWVNNSEKKDQILLL